MLGGCLILIAAFVAILLLELQTVQSLGLPHPWIIAPALALLATLAAGCVPGMAAALRRRAAPESDPSRWQEGETVRLGGTIHPVDTVLRTPFGHVDAVAMAYRARTTEDHNDARRGNPGWRGLAAVPSLLDTGSLRIPLVGTPSLRQFPEKPYTGNEVVRNAARHLAHTRWQIAPDLVSVDATTAAELFTHGAGPLPPHLIDRTAADLLGVQAVAEMAVGQKRADGVADMNAIANMNAVAVSDGDAAPGALGDSVEDAHAASLEAVYLERLGARPWTFAERAIPVGSEVTVTGTWRAFPPRIEIGYGVRTADHLIRPGRAKRTASSDLWQALGASAAIVAFAAGAHHVVFHDAGALYRALLAALSLPH